MTIITRSCRAPSNAERYDAWRKSGGNQLPMVPRRRLWRHEKPRIRLPYPDVEMTREPVKDCPQSDEFDERTPTIPQRAGRIAGKDMT